MLKLTFYITPGHGYLRVPKKTFLKYFGEPEKISTCSGHDETTLYLEEDCDASYFLNFLDEQGVEYKIHSVYKDNGFSITHNYLPELFDFKLREGKTVELCNGINATLGYINGTKLVAKANGATYKIPKTNPFKYIINEAN